MKKESNRTPAKSALKQQIVKGCTCSIILQGLNEVNIKLTHLIPEITFEVNNYTYILQIRIQKLGEFSAYPSPGYSDVQRSLEEAQWCGVRGEPLMNKVALCPQSFLALELDICRWIILYCEKGFPVLCKMFTSISGLYSPHVSSTPSPPHHIVTTKMSPDTVKGQNYPWLRTTILGAHRSVPHGH